MDFQLVINYYEIKLFYLLITAMTDGTSLNSLFSFYGSKILPVINCHCTVACDGNSIYSSYNDSFVFEISVIP